MKKILSTVLVLALVIGCLCTTVFAAGSVTINGSKHEYENGVSDKTIVVSFNLDKETAYNAYEFVLDYEEEYFQLESLENVGPGTYKASTKNAKIAMAAGEDVTHTGTLFTATFTVISDAVPAGPHYINMVGAASYICEDYEDHALTFNAAVINVAEEPTEAPTEEPTEAPTEEPTEAPTEEPTEAPTEEPTEAPTEEPTEAPTEEPTEAPTEEPTEAPTEEPTEAPTEEPTEAPTEKPTEPGKDPVPETGDITAPFVMAGTLVLVMMAAAFFFVTKRQTAK